MEREPGRPLLVSLTEEESLLGLTHALLKRILIITAKSSVVACLEELVVTSQSGMCIEELTVLLIALLCLLLSVFILDRSHHELLT